MKGIDLVVFDMAGTTIHDGDAVSSSFRPRWRRSASSRANTPSTRSWAFPSPRRYASCCPSRRRRRSCCRKRPRSTPTSSNGCASSTGRTRRSARVAGCHGHFPGVAQAGIKTALNTGFNRRIVSILLDRLGWREGTTVDATICSDEAAHGRPQPDMIQALMARLGVSDPARVVKVGDTPADLHEGTNARCGLVIGVTGGTHTRQELSRHPHTHLIETVAALPGLLRTEPDVTQPSPCKKCDGATRPRLPGRLFLPRQHGFDNAQQFGPRAPASPRGGRRPAGGNRRRPPCGTGPTQATPWHRTRPGSSPGTGPPRSRWCAAFGRRAARRRTDGPGNGFAAAMPSPLPRRRRPGRGRPSRTAVLPGRCGS